MWFGQLVVGISFSQGNWSSSWPLCSPEDEEDGAVLNRSATAVAGCPDGIKRLGAQPGEGNGRPDEHRGADVSGTVKWRLLELVAQQLGASITSVRLCVLCGQPSHQARGGFRPQRARRRTEGEGLT